jgi:hypothetical protein
MASSMRRSSAPGISGSSSGRQTLPSALEDAKELQLHAPPCLAARPRVVKAEGLSRATGVAQYSCETTQHEAALGDRVGYQGIDYQVDDILPTPLPIAALHLARLVAAGDVRFLEPATSDADDRALVLAEIEKLDITTPPPATIYHRAKATCSGFRCGQGDNR